MLSYTGHPLVDVGIATIAAFVGKRDPEALTEADLDRVADYMECNYTIDPLKSFLTVVFPNSGFTQPAYDKQPEKRAVYARRVLRAYRSATPTLDTSCAFTGNPAVNIPLDVKGQLAPGRTFRQHVPLLTGEDVINFFPYGDAGLPISGLALLALQALPLGCAKVRGRLLVVHADDPALTYGFANHFLTLNLRAIQTAQQSGDTKLAEYPRRAGTLILEVLVTLEEERQQVAGEAQVASVTAYHLSNSGQGPALDIYHLPLEIMDFVRVAMTPPYRAAWDAVCGRGWEVSRAKPSTGIDDFVARYNVLYEDLFRLPAHSARFIRRYFLRIPVRRSKAGDPRVAYSIMDDVDLVSWKLTDLFLRKVVNMNQNRIEHIRQLGDALAEYVIAENDRRFFHTFLTARRYGDLRAALVRASLARIKRGEPPLVAFDPFMQVFEQGEDLPYSDWRLARDLVLIRMIEQLHSLGWIQAHAEDMPEPAEVAEEEQTD